jgi:uncharacterized lipoprotein YbaY
MRIIRGAVVLSTPTPLSGAVVVVRLLDVSLVDAPARVIAETRFVLRDSGGAPTHRIPFVLTIDPTSALGAHASLSAEVRLGSGERLQAGDWVTTQSVALTELALQGTEPVEVPVTGLVAR